MALASHTMDGAKLLINSLTLTLGFMTSIIATVGENIQTIIERVRDEWDILQWRASDEYREMVKERLDQHARSMVDSSCKSPYFDET